MAGSRNRTAGHNLERWCVNLFKTLGLFPEAVSSRSESKRRDDQKVDIMYTGIFNFQCKNVATRINYVEVLSEMPVESGRINVIIEKKTKKSTSGRFIEEGKYAHLKLDDLIIILTKLKEYEDNNSTLINSANIVNNVNGENSGHFIGTTIRK